MNAPTTAADAALKRADVSAEAPKTHIPTLEERKRTSLAIARLALEVTPIPGYTLRWFENNPQRLFEAQNALWQFVNPKELDQFAHLRDRADRILHGGEVGGLVLMKLPNEIAALDKKLQEEDRATTAKLLETHAVGQSSNPYGNSHHYTPKIS